MQETWKEIIGYEGRYWISNLGNIKSSFLKGKNLKPLFQRDGYILCQLNDKFGNIKRFLIHRLVALYFVPNPRGLNEVNHIDGNKNNNRWDNLEWCTRQENMRHAFDMGLDFVPRGSANPNAKSFFQFDSKGNFIKEWHCINECARELYQNDQNVKANFKNDMTVATCIGNILNGKQKLLCDLYIFSFNRIINIEDYKRKSNARPVEATDVLTGEKYTFGSAWHIHNKKMPNGKTVDMTGISLCCRGKRKTHGGYYWRYK